MTYYHRNNSKGNNNNSRSLFFLMCQSMIRRAIVLRIITILISRRLRLLIGMDVVPRVVAVDLPIPVYIIGVLLFVIEPFNLVVRERHSWEESGRGVPLPMVRGVVPITVEEEEEEEGIMNA